ncbi:ATP-binding cassette domain-containing protein [Demequina silvatica]|uniref:ATP-binding cassette domain-containing protein n=1 Tax=Demequina silvatica TaxID=1638988 RepID=UPI000783D1D3|nr:ABC transporter ATP-binding protein [Demequina silvatica]
MTATTTGAGEAVLAHGVAGGAGAGAGGVVEATLTVPAATVTALIGPVGAGKTALLRMLAGRARAEAGDIRIAGEDPATDPAAVRAAVGWVPEQPGSWGAATCRRALTLTGLAHDQRAAAARERAAAVLDAVGLADVADRPARSLARVHRARLALAVALMGDPPVVMLDAPAADLDPRGRDDLRRILRGLAKAGTAVLISARDPDEVDEMIDDAVYIADGSTLDEQGTLRALDPRSRYLVESLDDGAVRALLDASHVDYEPVRDGVILRLDDADEAAQALAWLVRNGVPVHRFGLAGASGRAVPDGGSGS